MTWHAILGLLCLAHGLFHGMPGFGKLSPSVPTSALQSSAGPAEETLGPRSLDAREVLPVPEMQRMRVWFPRSVTFLTGGVYRTARVVRHTSLPRWSHTPPRFLPRSSLVRPDPPDPEA
jgi:hypothetical protein